MTYAYSGITHRLDSVSSGGTAYNFTHDANGNITQLPYFQGTAITGTRTIAYDGDNMPAVITTTIGLDTTVTAFAYNGMGGRVKKEVSGGSVTWYLGDHYEIKDGVVTKYIFAADRRVAKVSAGVVQYFSKDHLGSSTVVTDENGDLVESTDYRPLHEFSLLLPGRKPYRCAPEGS